MARRNPRARTEPPLWTATQVPRPVGAFAGRQLELERVSELVAHDVVFLFYGVAGIGKTELAFQAVQMLRSQSPWSEAVSVLVEIRRDVSVTRILTQLLDATGTARQPRRGHRTEESYQARMLESLSRVLDASPHIVVLDDLHNLPGERAAWLLEYLGRHVGRSRIFATSRQQVVFADAAPVPVITSLEPLDEAATAQMLSLLSKRLQVDCPDPAEVFRATRGSPFYVRRALARRAGTADALAESLRELEPTVRSALSVAAVAQRPLSRAEFDVDHESQAATAGALIELDERFLVDTARDTVVVHDLVRDALMRESSPREIAEAHVRAARLCLLRLERPGAVPLPDVIDATHHYMQAGDNASAWQVVERWHSTLAAHGDDHLLLEPLEQLRRRLPEQIIAIELLIARCLVRASMMDEASVVLQRVDKDALGAAGARYFALAGEVAQRRGDLPGAEASLQRALELADGESARFQIRLQTSVVAALQRHAERSREILDHALADVAQPSPRQRALWGWARGLSWLFDERFEFAAAEARRSREALAGEGRADLTNRLAMLEALSCIESDDMPGARVAARMIEDAGLRQPVAELYRTIARYADGDVCGASAVLLRLYGYLRDHGDTINAYLAAFYGSSACAAAGQLGEAQVLAQRAGELASEAGLDSLVARSLAQRALLASEAVQTPVAHKLADEALACDTGGPRSRATAHCAHAQAYTIEGNISAALDQVRLARDAVTGPGLDSARDLIDVEHAAIALIGGSLNDAVELVEPVVARYRLRSRDYDVARAQLILAGAYVARGRRTDLVFAEDAVTAARELADRGGLQSIQVGCAILSASLARLANRNRAAIEVLTEALRRLGPERGSLYANTLIGAIEGGVAAGLVPGAVALLGHLGLHEDVLCYIVDRHGRRAATTQDLERERRSRALFVDETQPEIVAACGAHRIAGRPVMCALLSQLIQARGESVAPARLYKQVWGDAEYHPLQHRNRLYVAINRLRKSLRDVFGEREVIERAGGGWRLAPGFDASVAIPVRA